MQASYLYRLPFVLVFLYLLALTFIWAGQAMALQDERSEGWYQDAQSLARDEGYKVISTAELVRLYLLQEDFQILDVRFAYEHNQSKLPGAKSLPFDLSHRYGLDQGQKMALLQTLGADKDKMIVIYCRDFR